MMIIFVQPPLFLDLMSSFQRLSLLFSCIQTNEKARKENKYLGQKLRLKEEDNA